VVCICKNENFCLLILAEYLGDEASHKNIEQFDIIHVGASAKGHTN
jgi:hypothetical protein